MEESMSLSMEDAVEQSAEALEIAAAAEEPSVFVR